MYLKYYLKYMYFKILPITGWLRHLVNAHEVKSVRLINRCVP